VSELRWDEPRLDELDNLVKLGDEWQAALAEAKRTSVFAAADVARKAFFDAGGIAVRRTAEGVIEVLWNRYSETPEHRAARLAARAEADRTFSVP
jgi:hypothetical protein